MNDAVRPPRIDRRTVLAIHLPVPTATFDALLQVARRAWPDSYLENSLDGDVVHVVVAEAVPR